MQRKGMGRAYHVLHTLSKYTYNIQYCYLCVIIAQYLLIFARFLH